MSHLFIPSSPDSSQHDSQKHTSNLSFVASTSQVVHLAESVAAITSVSSQALMILNECGITFYAEYNHILNVQLTIDASLFSSFSLSDGQESQNCPNRELRLGVDLQLVGDALAAAAATTLPRARNGQKGASMAESVMCYIKYYGEGSPLLVEFEDRLMSEVIEFDTFYYEHEYPYDAQPTQNEQASELLVNHERVALEIILKSDVLANLLADLQQLNTQELHLYASNLRPRGKVVVTNQLNFLSKGAIGYLKLSYPNAKTMLEKLDTFRLANGSMTETSDSIVTSFNFLPFLRIIKAVRLSSRCKMMKDLSGVFSVQLLCRNTQVSNYPGTLITFNMLEMATGTDDFGQLRNTDINTLFDDEVYQQIKEIDPANDRALDPQEDVIPHIELSHAGPLSYASFKMTGEGQSGSSNGTEASTKRRKVNDQIPNHNPDHNADHDNDHDFTTVGGAVEIPLFL